MNFEEYKITRRKELSRIRRQKGLYLPDADIERKFVIEDYIKKFSKFNILHSFLGFNYPRRREWILELSAYFDFSKQCVINILNRNYKKLNYSQIVQLEILDNHNEVFAENEKKLMSNLYSQRFPEFFFETFVNFRIKVTDVDALKVVIAGDYYIKKLWKDLIQYDIN